MRRPFLRCGALGKLEVADACTPVKAGRGRVVLVRVIEGAVVDWINGHIAVIAPAIAGTGSLAARSSHENSFTLAQSIDGIGHQPAGPSERHRGVLGIPSKDPVAV